MPRPPAAVTRSAVSSMVSGRPSRSKGPRALRRRRAPTTDRLLRPVQYTTAPIPPSAVATPRPAPRVAPATTATMDCLLCMLWVKLAIRAGSSKWGIRPKLRRRLPRTLAGEEAVMRTPAQENAALTGPLIESGEAFRRLGGLEQTAAREHFDVIVIGGGQAG